MVQRWIVRSPGAGLTSQRVAAAYTCEPRPAGRSRMPAPPPVSAASCSRRASSRESAGIDATTAPTPLHRRHSAIAQV